MNKASQHEKSNHHGVDNLYLCYQCGTCSGGCPVTRLVPEYNVRKIVKHRKENKIDVNDRFLWYCLTCYICYERCPQEVKPIEVIHSLTNFISKSGDAPSSLKEGNKKILAVGRSGDISKFTEQKRKRLGLPELKADVSKDFKEIAKITGLAEMVQ
jgi:heterodisulfide reductase subunit C